MVKPKLLVILNRIVIGGQALDTIPLLYYLQGEFDIKILYGCREKGEEDAAFLLKKFPGLNTVAVPHFRKKPRILSDARTFFFILGAVVKFKPAIVHTHGPKPGIFGRTAAFLAGVKCVVHTFHGHHFHSYFGKFASNVIVFTERSLAAVTTSIVAISDEQKRELVEKYRIAGAKKVQVIPLGIDENMFRVNDTVGRQVFRDAYLLKNTDIAVGIIGRIVPVKNYKLFVDVAYAVMNAAGFNKTVKFFIIGGGNGETEVQAMLTGKGIKWCGKNGFTNEASVIFTSWIQDVSTAVNGLDIVVLTSHNEGTPLSLIEAQFCGKPVVATNVGGVRDTFINGASGLLVEPGNVPAFAAAVSLLVNDDALRGRMGAKAADFAGKNFSKLAEVQNYRQLYANCAK